MNANTHDADHAYSLLSLGEQLIHARVLQVTAELGTADLLAEGPRSVDDLAAATGSDPDALYRMLRLMAAYGIFRETGSGGFELTAQGGPLRSDHPTTVRSVLMMDAAVAPLVLEGAQYSLRTGQSTFPYATGEEFYDYLRHHPEHGELFDRAMDDLTRVMTPAVLEAYDFTGAHHIVDIGGGYGTFAQAVLKQSPESVGTVLEGPHVAETAAERLRAAGLADRCTVVGGDFFREVPESGDLYMLKWILHNWSDERALDILRSCRRAMRPGTRLLIIETVLPEDGSLHSGLSMDLSMLVGNGGRERTEQQFIELLAAAELRLERVLPTSSPYSVLEAAPV